MPAVKPIRSLLFIPGNRTDWMPKAAAVGADAVVFDLEGALPAGEKDAGRRAVRSVIDEADSDGPAVLVRVNDVRSPEFAADLDAVVARGLAGVLLPQVLDADDVTDLDRRLTELEEARSLPVGSIPIDPLLETPTALRAAYEIATCTPRIAYMGAGISKRGDIARTMGYRWSEEGLETLYFRSKVLLDLRAAGVPNPLSGVWGEVANLDGLRRFAEQTRGLGYEGMMVIHPSHVAIVNELFAPTDEEIERWRETIREMEEAQAAGVGAMTFKGELIDEAHVVTARQQLRQAERWAGK